ncbi:uncharacterized protein LOC143463377 [Clavelina lepadiformis]|uniref:uncharacterized protein LOC143463377 n=1 Tax=Clavelina lepadiformis TaxID=159417 RepID=UPI004043214B
MSRCFTQAGPTGIITLPECNRNGRFCTYRNGTIFVCESKGLQCCWNQKRSTHQIITFTRGHYECCPETGTNYNMHTHICLNGQILKKSRDSESACAFTQRYDTNTEKCCLKNEKYGQVHFKNPSGICCNEKYLTDPQLDCCQGVIYNVTKQACCKSGDGDYTLHNNSNACCLNVPYNSAVQYCGDHGVQEKDQTEIRQCNGTPYDPTWHMCCGDTLADTRTHLCHWITGRLVLKPSYGIHHDKVCRTRHTLVSYYSGISDRSGERQVRRI